MADKDSRMLVQAILDYLGWIKSLEKHRGKSTGYGYNQVLTAFLIFALSKGLAWQEMFTPDTLEAFRAHSGFKNASRALTALAQYLFSQGKIDQPLEIKEPRAPLPAIYEDYLRHQEQGQEVSPKHRENVGRVLTLFHHYLQSNQTPLSALNMEHLDAFMATFKVAESTRSTYRYFLRGFLKYLYHERGVLHRDLAPLLVGPPQFAQAKPPKFLRPTEVKKLFASLKLTTPTQIRTCAMVHLAYTLGLRPVEISRITLNDISFQQGELTLRERKGGNPTTLPVPEKALKATALYAAKARPQGLSRHLFLTHQFPYHPLRANTVIQHISRAMKQAGLPSSAYWLRHTYAQNLLQIGQSIYEVKEMMGHQNIQSTHRYLHINVAMMRKVLFDEEL